MEGLKSNKLFEGKSINGNTITNEMDSLINRIVRDYQDKSFKCKINYNEVLVTIEKDVENLVKEFNNVVSRFSDKSFDEKNYLKLSHKEIPSKYIEEISLLRSKIKNRNSLINKIKRDLLFNVGLHTDRYNNSYFVTDLIPNVYKEMFLSECVESDRLVTIKFDELQFHQLYKDTKLSEFFGDNFINNVLELVSSKGIECTDKEIRHYLLIKTCDDYRTINLYMNNKDVLDSIDKVLHEYIDGVTMYYKFNPLGTMTMFILSVLEDCDDVYLYHYDYNSVTLRLSDGVDLDLFLVGCRIQMKLNLLGHVPFKTALGNSLKENLQVLV